MVVRASYPKYHIQFILPCKLNTIFFPVSNLRLQSSLMNVCVVHLLYMLLISVDKYQCWKDYPMHRFDSDFLTADPIIAHIDTWQCDNWFHLGDYRFPDANYRLSGISTTSTKAREISKTRRCIVETFVKAQIKLNCTYSLIRSKRQTIY